MYKNTERDRDKIYYTCSKTKKQCIQFHKQDRQFGLAPGNFSYKLKV